MGWSRQQGEANTLGRGLGASSEKFQLANAVLNEQYDKAGGIMRRLDQTAIGNGDYREWPIFKEFRATPQFAASYKEVFSEEFTEVAAAASPEKQQD